MAAAAAAIGSCFSPIATRHLRSKLLSSDAMRRALPAMPSLTRHMEHLSITAVVHRKPLPKMSAAIAQEEAGAVVEEEEKLEEKEAEAAAVVEEDKLEAKEAEAVAVEEEAVAEPVMVQNTKLYFGNLPYNCDSAQLAGIIQEYASPEMVEVLYDRDTGRSRGFAFVTMSSVEDCETVIQNLDGSQYAGRTLRVNFSDKPKAREPLYPETEYKLFVGNLSWSVTSESLTQVFQEHGNVVGARVLYDGDTGRSRGYGFVCYSSKEEMDAAMESLNGMELEGRAMRISLALGKRSVSV